MKEIYLSKPDFCKDYELRAVFMKNESRVYRLQKGDCFCIVSDSIPVKVGDKYLDYPAAITEIYYEPKKWWQFWKKKKQLGYEVMWMGD